MRFGKTVAAAVAVAVVVLVAPFAAWANGDGEATPEQILIESAWLGHREDVEILLREGIDPNFMEEDGVTALIAAADAGHAPIVELLLEAGADPNLAAMETALVAAVTSGWHHIIELLISRGADPNMANVDGWTPLMEAVLQEDLELSRFLLEIGADPDARDREGYSPRQIADDNGDDEIMALLDSVTGGGVRPSGDRGAGAFTKAPPAKSTGAPSASGPSGATAVAAADTAATERSQPAPTVASTAEAEVEITNVVFGAVFPVLFKYYDENAIGTATVANTGDVDVEDVVVSLFIRNYMDNPKASATIASLAAGASVDVALLALFSEEVLNISEGTRVSALLEATYTANGEQAASQNIESLDINHRNALTWDDDRKACSFVTAKDPGVLAFARNVSGAISRIGSPSINNNLKLAMGIHEALAIHGMSYVVDPSTPYIEFSQDASQVDFLQFPVQSLNFAAGDCDDLAILYSALLEAVGVETALVTVPEHLLMAYSLGISAEQARSDFLKPDSLIFREGQAWMPVETTETDGGFLNAWAVGAAKWRESSARERAAFISVHESWEEFLPTGFRSQTIIAAPPRAEVQAAFRQELTTFVNREVFPQLAELDAKVARDGASSGLANRRGVLLARYGLYDQAVQVYNDALAAAEYVPARLNLGHIYFVQDEVQQALVHYDQAAVSAPNHALVLLAVARANHKLENYGDTQTAYRKLTEVAPATAQRFGYLDLRGSDATRASGIARDVLWAYEE